MRGNSHVRFGGRAEETDRLKGPHRASARPIHTAVSLWVAAGASPKQIATWAGHNSVSVVLDRYGHLFPGHEAAVLDRLEDFACTPSRTDRPLPLVARVATSGTGTSD